jgi:hypothetical protein
MPPIFPPVPAYNALQPYHQHNPYPQQDLYHGRHNGLPSNGPYPPYNTTPQPPPQTVVVNQEDPNKGKKHGLFSGKLGNTVVYSLFSTEIVVLNIGS